MSCCTESAGYICLQANVMENFFEREVKRLAFVEERKKIREAEKREHDALETKKQQEKKIDETDADIEAKQRMVCALIDRSQSSILLFSQIILKVVCYV